MAAAAELIENVDCVKDIVEGTIVIPMLTSDNQVSESNWSVKDDVFGVCESISFGVDSMVVAARSSISVTDSGVALKAACSVVCGSVVLACMSAICETADHAAVTVDIDDISSCVCTSGSKDVNVVLGSPDTIVCPAKSDIGEKGNVTCVTCMANDIVSIKLCT